MKKHDTASDIVPRDPELDALRENSDPEVPNDLKQVILKQAHTELTRVPGSHRFTKVAVGIGMAASVMLVVLLPHQSPEENLKQPAEYQAANEAAPVPALAPAVDSAKEFRPVTPEYLARNDGDEQGSVSKRPHAKKATAPNLQPLPNSENLLSDAGPQQVNSNAAGGEVSGVAEAKAPSSTEGDIQTLQAARQKAMIAARAKAESEKQQAEASARISVDQEQRLAAMQKSRAAAQGQNEVTRDAVPVAAMPPAPAAAVMEAPRYSEVGVSSEGIAITPEYWMGLWQPQSTDTPGAKMGRWKIWPVVSANAVKNFKLAKITGATGNNRPEALSLTTIKAQQGKMPLEALGVEMTIPFECKAGSCLSEAVKLPPEVTRHLLLEGVSIILLP